MTIISDNAGRSITLMRKSHNTGMNGDWKSPEVNMFDKKKIVSRLCLEWVCSPVLIWECTIITPFIT